MLHSQNIKVIFNKRKIHACSNPIEVLDIKCVLGHVTAVQIENKKLMLQNHRRTRQGARGVCLAPHFWKNMEIRVNVRKIKKIRADLSENRLNSGDFVTILHKISGKLSTHPLESISPVRLYVQNQCAIFKIHLLPTNLDHLVNTQCIIKEVRPTIAYKAIVMTFGKQH